MSNVFGTMDPQGAKIDFWSGVVVGGFIGVLIGLWVNLSLSPEDPQIVYIGMVWESRKCEAAGGELEVQDYGGALDISCKVPEKDIFNHRLYKRF